MAKFKRFLGSIKGKIVIGLVAIIIVAGSFGTGTFYPNYYTVDKLVYKVESILLDRAKNLGLHEPDFKYNSPDTFTQAVSDCVDYLNFTVHHDKRIPKGLIIAMAGIESGGVQVDLVKKVITYLVLEPGILKSHNSNL